MPVGSRDLPSARNAAAALHGRVPANRRERLAPALYAGGMLALGAALMATKPRIGHVPPPAPLGDRAGRSRLRGAAGRGRDGVAAFAPTNVTDSIGRSLLIGGTALLIARVLDEVASR